MSLLVKGVTSFLALTDTPASYAGQAARVAAVNTGEGALEFIDPPEHTTSSSSTVEPQSFLPTTNNTWQDFDLSKVVPEGATGAIFHLMNTHATIYYAVGLRKKGSTDSYVGRLRQHTHSWAMVGLDENRKCQGLAGNINYVNFLLVGYTGANYTFFTNGYNIIPATKKAWVETNIATECPGAIAAILEFSNFASDDNLVGARKHGSTDDRRTRASHHFWMVVGLDANQHLDLYDEDWPDPPEAVNLIGYITAGVTMYTNATDISPTQDDAYHTVSLAAYLANPIIAFIEIENSAVSFGYAIIKNAWQGDIYYDGDGHNFVIPHPNTPNATLRVKLSHPGFHIYLLGIG